MKPTSRPVAFFLRASLAIAIPLVLMPAAYSAKADTSPPVAAPEIRKGILETTAGVYEFTPNVCGIYEEDGIFDIEIQGSGTAPDGEVFYFDFSSIANEMSIELGVDAPYQTAERQIRAGQFVSKAFVVEVTDKLISVPEITLVDEQGQQLDSNANLQIDCGA